MIRIFLSLTLATLSLARQANSWPWLRNTSLGNTDIPCRQVRIPSDWNSSLDDNPLTFYKAPHKNRLIHSLSSGQ